MGNSVQQIQIKEQLLIINGGFMIEILTRLCWPILKLFETNEEPANYKKSHRVALNILGALFILLSLGSVWVANSSDELGSLLSVVVFFCIGIVSSIVGAFGSNAAVSKIWGTK
jgi:hypothetical protein